VHVSSYSYIGWRGLPLAGASEENKAGDGEIISTCREALHQPLLSRPAHPKRRFRCGLPVGCGWP
jgi:hypothetical protein